MPTTSIRKPRNSQTFIFAQTDNARKRIRLSSGMANKCRQTHSGTHNFILHDAPRCNFLVAGPTILRRCGALPQETEYLGTLLV